MAGVLKYKDPSTNEWVRVSAPTSDISVDSVMQMELLWENPEPTAEFAAQTISLDLSEYSFVAIYFNNTDTRFVPVGKKGEVYAPVNKNHAREFEVYTDGVKFYGAGYFDAYGTTTLTTSNHALKPVAIYGIKNTSLTVNNSKSGPEVEDTDHPGCFYRMVNGVQEWLNPPMELGVEYKTTERYMSKPVYVKPINLGAVVDGTGHYMEHGIENIYDPISVEGVWNGLCALPYYEASNDYFVRISSFSKTKVLVKSNYNFNNGADVRAIFKYTKTTD